MYTEDTEDASIISIASIQQNLVVGLIALIIGCWSVYVVYVRVHNHLHLDSNIQIPIYWQEEPCTKAKASFSMLSSSPEHFLLLNNCPIEYNAQNLPPEYVFPPAVISQVSHTHTGYISTWIRTERSNRAEKIHPEILAGFSNLSADDGWNVIRQSYFYCAHPKLLEQLSLQITGKYALLQSDLLEWCVNRHVDMYKQKNKKISKEDNQVQKLLRFYASIAKGEDDNAQGIILQEIVR